MFLVYLLGEISPDLCSLYLQMYDYFFPFSDIHICYLYPFHWRGRGGGEISSPLKLFIYANSQSFLSIFIIFIMCCFWPGFLAFSLGKISLQQSDVSSLFTGGNFPALISLYLRIYDYFVPFSKYSSVLFLKFPLELKPDFNSTHFAGMKNVQTRFRGH